MPTHETCQHYSPDALSPCRGSCDVLPACIEHDWPVKLAGPLLIRGDGDATGCILYLADPARIEAEADEPADIPPPRPVDPFAGTPKAGDLVHERL